MRRLTIITAVLFLLLSQAAAPVAAKDNWTRVRSKNFLLIGNASEKDIRRVGLKLEQFRDVFSRLLPQASMSSPIPTTVIVFKSDGSYKPYKPLYQGKPASVAGYFQPGEDVNYITLTSESSAENPYRIIFHEFVHLLVNSHMRNPPAWFNEGVAEYYSTFEVTDGDRKAQLGKVIPSHVFLLRQKFIPLRTLFAVDHSSSLYNERDKQSIFYAESWAFIHYLLLGSNGERKPQLSEFLGKLAAGLPVDAAFQQAFKSDFAQVEKQLKEYVSRTSYPGQVATFEKKLEFDSEMESAPLTEAEALGYLGDLLLHTNRLEDAATRLQDALAIDPNLPMAHASLGMLLMRQRKFAEAREHLERAITANTKNYLAHYYYAEALSREGMGENGLVFGYNKEAAGRMRAELRKAIDLKPDFPESYRLLAFVNMVTGEQLDESIALLQRAVSLSPGREQYAFLLAQIHLRKQNTKIARQILEPIAQSGADPQTRAHARSLLAQVASYEEQLKSFNSRNSSISVESLPEREPVTLAPNEVVDEKTVRNVQHAALQEALRKPAAGEERVSGQLLRIDCGAKSIVFSVQAANRTIRLGSRDFERIDFTTYTTEVAGELGCGPRNPATPVIMTYRPVKDARTRLDGELVAVEFIPKDFVLK